MTVSAAVNAYTANYSFRLINFNYPRWHTEEWKNWQAVDGVLRSIGATQTRGIWENSIAYVVGDRVIDSTTGLIWICEVAHTSDATDSFATDRASNPTYWEAFTTVPNYRGAWVTGSSYSIGDIVVVNGGTWYFCIDAHTAAASFATDAAKWEVIFDITSFTNYYYGGRSTETSLRPDGTASQAGDTYYNSTSSLLRLYNGTVWVNYNSAGTAASGITVTPVGSLVATNVQSALQELDADLTTAINGAVPTARTVTAGTGLTGGGALSANITLSIANLGVGTAQLADLGVTAAKIANDTITATQIAANAVGASELADNAVDTAAIANDAVTFAKIQNSTTNQRIVGRNTAAAGDFEEVTINQALDWLGTTRGTILIRGASAWTPLVPSTAGQVLTSNGVGADPSYQAVTLPNGTIVDRSYAEYTTNASLSTLIPADNTIPQVTEGTQVLSATITPKDTTNRVRVRVTGFGSREAGAGAVMTVAIFVNGAANATHAFAVDVVDNTLCYPFSGEYEYVPGAASLQTITVRVGNNSGGVRLNGTGGGALYGGVARTTIILEEIAA